MKDVLKENERLLEQAISTDIVNLVVNANVNYACKIANECKRCVTRLQRDFIKKECYDKLFKQYTTLEKHCISLEVNNQLKQESFQRNNSFSQQSALTFDQLFEINDLKAQSQEKDTVIMKLKERIKSLCVVLSLTTTSKLARWNLRFFKLEFTMLTLGSSLGSSTMVVVVERLGSSEFTEFQDQNACSADNSVYGINRVSKSCES
nr:hypothetical protein [Tanacetum cinerariifolium]